MPRALTARAPIRPPAMLGVIGGGQLGLFFAKAAQAMGYRVAVLDPDPASPAMAVADERLVAAYDDTRALDRLAECSSAVTVEFESVPAASVFRVEERCVTVPGGEAIAVLQDRIREKRFLAAAGLPVVPFVAVIEAGDLAAAQCYPGILKTARQGYDGKGQASVANAREALEAWERLGGQPCVLERRVPLDLELSVVLARGSDGAMRAFPAAENRHRDGILELSIAPARVSTALAQQAEACARRIAECLDYAGVLGVEFFVSGGELLVNEIAPRPHNSGHYTIDACATSQFEQQVRALCGLPLGDPRIEGAAAMVNVLGDAWRGAAPDWDRIAGSSGARVHLYGKTQPRPGRKMAHLTVLRGTADEAARAAEGCLGRLGRSRPGRVRREPEAVG